MVLFRVAFVLLTGIGMLACPFVCMANVRARGAPAEQPTGCACCRHRCQAPSGERESEDKSPVAPQQRGPFTPEDCDCICLCKGAVEAAGTRKTDLESPSTGIARLDLAPLAKADAASGALVSFAEAPPPPRLGSGRLIRLAFASLLL